MKNLIDNKLMPKRATTLSAGYDIFATEDVVLHPGEFKTLDTGIVFEDNDKYFSGKILWKRMKNKHRLEFNLFQSCEYVGLIFPRSSYGFKYGLRFANSVCIIDQDYRDTIKLKVTVDTDIEIKKGDRIAQMVFVPWLVYGGEISPSDKRYGGIGSTGN